jgi:tRNA (guanine26-N2/guanine27-N2)-dimethyltransferase
MEENNLLKKRPRDKNDNNKNNNNNNNNIQKNKNNKKEIKKEKNKSKIKEEKKLEEINEGKAHIKLINSDKTFCAFYNPAQELNRDLTVISIFTYFNFNKFRKPKEIERLKNYKFSIIEPLSATGLRGIRYYNELPKDKINLIVNNDMDIKAVECININIKLNNIDENIFKVYQKDASQLLYQNFSFFDIVDIDPYGSAIPFIDAAIMAAKNNGLLCLTFTDTPVLCGNYPETTLYKYGSIPYKTSSCHEMAKRIALYSVSCSASKYKKVIKPLMCYNAEFYIRLFLIVKDSPEECKSNCLKYGYVFHCRQCQNKIIIPMAKIEENKIKNGKANSLVKFNNILLDKKLCEICEGNMFMCGPFWIDNLYDENWLEKIKENLNSEEFKYLKYNKRIENFITGMQNELTMKDYPFYYDYSFLGRDITLSTFKLVLFEGALNSLGYKLVQSYYDPNLFKTDAPTNVLYDILKQYKKENSKNEDEYYKNIDKNSYKYKILSKEIKYKPNFIQSQKKNNIKYPENPFPNWGPKGKAK